MVLPDQERYRKYLLYLSVFIVGDVLQGMKKLYRAPLDYLEEVTTGMADTVFVNSGFTKEVTTVVLACRDVLVPKFIMSDPGSCLFLFEVTFTSFFKDKKLRRNHKTVGMEVFRTIFA